MNSTPSKTVCEHCKEPLSGLTHTEPDLFGEDKFYHLNCYAIVYAKQEAATAHLMRLERGEK